MYKAEAVFFDVRILNTVESYFWPVNQVNKKETAFLDQSAEALFLALSLFLSMPLALTFQVASRLPLGPVRDRVPSSNT